MIRERFTLICVEADGKPGKKRLAFMSPVRYERFVQTLGIGQELRCDLSDPVRDTKHNSKLHAVIDEGAEALGWEDREEFKHQVLLRLRPDGVDDVTGFPRRKRTRDMSNEEIDQLVMEIKVFVQHLMPGYIFRFDFELQSEAIETQRRTSRRGAGESARQRASDSASVEV